MTARAFSPSARFAAQARKAESAPPEKATITEPNPRRHASKRSCFSIEVSLSVSGFMASFPDS